MPRLLGQPLHAIEQNSQHNLRRSNPQRRLPVRREEFVQVHRGRRVLDGAVLALLDLAVEMLEYYAGIQEAWDGPALLIFCDGKQLGASLDRNGLRPARFLETNDGLIGFMSETGVIEVEDEDVVSKGRLGPGNMITLDLETGVFRRRAVDGDRARSRFFQIGDHAQKRGLATAGGLRRRR